MARIVRVLAGVVLSVGLAGVASAGDGRIEINQASVDAAGGFPYYLSQPGSYVLTSDLVVPNAALTGLVISAPSFTLDLNGFAIRGPVTCDRSSSYTASTTTCSATGADGISIGDVRGTIRNGRVSNVGGRCLAQQSNYAGGLVIEDMVFSECGEGGVRLYVAVLRRSVVAENGGPGVDDCYCGGAGMSTIVEDNAITFNNGNGVGVQGTVRNNRITRNAGVGIKTSGSVHAVGNYIQSNEGRAIEAGGGSYLGNEIRGNLSTTPGQVSGSITDAGGNVVH